MKATRACCLVLKSNTASRVQIVLDDFNVEAIRKEVHVFYGRKEYPTLDSYIILYMYTCRTCISRCEFLEV